MNNILQSLVRESCDPECNGYRFVLDDAKYLTMSPLNEIEDGIHSQVAKIEDDFKVFIFLLTFFLIPRVCHSWPL